MCVHYAAPLSPSAHAGSFAWWRPGQFVRYRRTVAIPAAAATGTYRVWAGLFRGEQRRSATARGGVEVRDDRVLVGTIEVRR